MKLTTQQIVAALVIAGSLTVAVVATAVLAIQEYRARRRIEGRDREVRQ